tara:strand:- start:1082 stop:1960 length:879 start_codon:yes stop_codon:yes gene_type:complete
MAFQFDIVSKIKSLEEELKASESKVAQTILEDLEWAAHASIHEMATKAEVSEATVTRFSRAVGCQDVRDLKRALVASVAIGQRFIEGIMDPVIEENGAIGQVVAGALQALKAATDQTSQKKVELAAAAINEGRRMAVFGCGGGGSVIAEDAVNRLFRFGVQVTAHRDFVMQRMVASTLDQECCLLVISTTGHITELNENAQIAQQYGVKVIAITRGDSPLAELADIHLQVHVPEEEGIFKATSSRYALLAVVDAIALEVGMLRQDSSKEVLRRIKYNLDSIRGADRRFPVGD